MQQSKYFCYKLYGTCMKVPTQIRWEHANEKKNCTRPRVSHNKKNIGRTNQMASYRS